MSEIKAKERQQQNRFLSAWKNNLNNNNCTAGSKTTAALLGTLTSDLSPAVAVAAALINRARKESIAINKRRGSNLLIIPTINITKEGKLLRKRSKKINNNLIMKK
uniref:Uncharacterized protein n=1 Tax=Meloidogyne hapla TaxID=6305 RepID=A0A1I8BWY6_MELHA